MLSKRQSLSTTTVLFRTTFIWTIKLNLLLKWHLGSNLSQTEYWRVCWLKVFCKSGFSFSTDCYVTKKYQTIKDFPSLPEPLLSANLIKEKFWMTGQQHPRPLWILHWLILPIIYRRHIRRKHENVSRASCINFDARCDIQCSVHSNLILILTL